MRPTPAVPAATACAQRRQLVTQSSPLSRLPGERRCLSSALCSLVTGAPRRLPQRTIPRAFRRLGTIYKSSPKTRLDFSHRTHVRGGLATRPAPRAHMATVTRAGHLRRRRRLADSNRRCPRHGVPPDTSSSQASRSRV